jgi:hypothetical protein
MSDQLIDHLSLPTVLEHQSPAYNIQQVLLERDYDESAWNEMDDDSYVTALMHSTWFRTTGMTIPKTATDADLFVVMRGSRALHGCDAWVRGDIINWIRDNRYQGGDIPRDELVKIAKELGVASAKRLLNNATTARMWPIEQRYPAHELTYSHHEELNKLPASERLAWAERAVSEGLSIAALRAALEDDAVSIDPEAGSGSEQVSFASEKVDKKLAVKMLAKAIAQEAVNVGNVQLGAENVLTNYLSVGMLRFPAKAWAQVMSAITGKEGSEE